MKHYFLDESGHGGDLASTNLLDFSGQPVFALGCVGIDDEAALAAELERLRAKHQCGAGELKSSSLGAKLPAFACDLMEWLVVHDAAIFVEIVEKRFFIAIHVVNNLLCGRYSLDDVDQESRSLFAEFLSRSEFEPILLGYTGACRSEALGDVTDLLNLLWDALDESDEDVARTLQVLTMYARDHARRDDVEVGKFLPIPDLSVTGKKVWMLPNLTSLTNIYGRINQSRRQGLDGVTLVHDIQLQYDKVLSDGKAMLEKLAAENAMPVVPFADYKLRGNVTMRFASSAEESCLQAADLLAGSAMRFVRSGFPRQRRSDPALRQAFFKIYETGNPFTATGINLVVTDAVLDRLQIPNIPSAPFVF